jgi:hypothetical protein
MKKLIGSCLALVLSIAAPALAQTSVAGDWDVTIVSPQGPNTVRVSFKQDGEKISGIFKSQMGELPFENGSITGDDLKFAFTIPVQGQQLEITMTGKVDGASMAGKADFGGFGEGDWTAKRAPAAAADAASTTAASTTTAATTTAPKPAASGGLSGHWDITLKTQMGDLPATADITDTAGKLTGTLTGPQGAIDIAGTFDGNAIKLEFVARTPQGDIPITMTGDVSGDAISGKAEFGGMGQGEWIAKRAKQ